MKGLGLKIVRNRGSVETVPGFTKKNLFTRLLLFRDATVQNEELFHETAIPLMMYK